MREMLRTFNCGVGMIVVVAPAAADAVASLLEEAGEGVMRLGSIVTGEGVVFNGSLAL